MKRFYNTMITAACAIALIASCTTEHENPVLDGNAIKPAISSQIPPTAVVRVDNLDSLYATVTFTPAVYSIAIPVTNELQISTAASFPPENTAKLGAASSEKSISLSYKMLNTAIVAAGGQTFTPNAAWLRLRSYVSATTGSPLTELHESYSDAVQISVTPYEPQPSFIYVPGAHQGWNPATAPKLCSLTDNGVYTGYVLFVAANVEFKLTQAANWDLNWGSPDGSALTQNGDNIKSINSGYHRLTADLNSMTFTQEAPFNWGLVGTINDWGSSPDIPLDYNPDTRRWETSFTCGANALIKFRLNSDWGINYGKDDNEGDLKAAGGDIAISAAGTYSVTMDELNMVYTLTRQ